MRFFKRNVRRIIGNTLIMAALFLVGLMMVPQQSAKFGIKWACAFNSSEWNVNDGENRCKYLFGKNWTSIGCQRSPVTGSYSGYCYAWINGNFTSGNCADGTYTKKK